MKRYIDVILPLFVPKTLTYSIPDGTSPTPSPGCRVTVTIKDKKKYTAIIRKVYDDFEPQGFKIKEIDEVIDSSPIVTQEQMALWEWIANYYMCTVGEVFKAAIPSRLRPGSETVIMPNDKAVDKPELNGKESLIAELVCREKKISIQKIESELKTGGIIPAINRLLEKQVIVIKEEVRQSRKPATITLVRLAKEYASLDADKVTSLCSNISGADILLTKFFELCRSGNKMAVGKNTLANSVAKGKTALRKLICNGILETFEHEIDNFDSDSIKPEPINELNEVQANALKQINAAFSSKNVCLLHGVTSSGKTEIYIHFIDQALRQGKQVLYMLPEIALTTQITSRLARFFGDRQVVYHSRLNDTERLRIWKRQLGDNPFPLVIGVRSSIFLPYRNLGLVIVDEEHEPSFKQEEPAPRYQARDTAIVLASIFKAKTLLGTATPSLESYYNAKNGKYALVEINKRYKEMQLPQIITVDLKEQQKRKALKGQFSQLLIDKITEALDKKEQVILFQNRRGFSPMIECHTCGWVPKCSFCDVSMTYHKQQNVLSCHYCGYTIPVPKTCPACGEHEMSNRGFGTERIEEDLKTIFPNARTTRLDIDTTKSKNAYKNILEDFSNRKIDILVGTQMLSKGLDFDNVSIVGIMNADNIMNFPDFRAHERAFQIMSQVAGRAGRKNRQGTVILQTYSPDHYLINMVKDNNYAGMYENEMEERELFKYPPFYRLINIVIKHKDYAKAETAANILGTNLRQIFGDRILGPDKPPIARMQTYHIRKIILRLENGINIKYAKKQLRMACSNIPNYDGLASVVIYCDVDPY